MRALFKALVVDWRLELPVGLGVAVACGVWLAVPNQTVATVAWIVIVGSGTLLGVIWQKRYNR
jgi:hypothetical protein